MPAITDKEIENAIFRPALSKAPGADGIPNRVLGKIAPLILPYLHKFLNDCVNLAYYRRHFKKLITIVLKKPSGEETYDYTSAKAYRIIKYVLNGLLGLLAGLANRPSSKPARPIQSTFLTSKSE